MRSRSAACPRASSSATTARYLYVGNFITKDISILRVEGDRIVDTGKRIPLAGHPASMRGRTR